MSEHLRDYLRVDVLREQERGAGVPETVEADLREPGALEEPGEVPVSEVRGVDYAPDLVGEDEAAGALKGAHLLHLL